MSAAVLFEVRELPEGRKLGVATLNAESSLNALNEEMIPLLAGKLAEWRDDASVVAVFLQGAGNKAFCAGGDIRRLYQAMTSEDSSGIEWADRFFDAEYDLDLMIHRYPKPFIVWGSGIVMGGGMGLFAGASFRIVTETTRIAMPEITIGLYPDVGATHFLARLPDRLGLFLGLTAVRLKAADVLFLQMADFFAPADMKGQIIDDLLKLPWTASAGQNRLLLTDHFARLHRQSLKPTELSEVFRHLDSINALVRGDSILEVARRFRDYQTSDAWLKSARDAFLAGSPTSAAVIFEQFRRGAALTLEQAFELEKKMSRRFARGHDFKEGIRALLIDKDNKPKWNPPQVEDVLSVQVEGYFR
jgi:enoyl-CoA hydratase/carnithine racemase